jgi:hypothetical protein
MPQFLNCLQHMRTADAAASLALVFAVTIFANAPLRAQTDPSIILQGAPPPPRAVQIDDPFTVAQKALKLKELQLQVQEQQEELRRLQVPGPTTAGAPTSSALCPIRGGDQDVGNLQLPWMGDPVP